MKRLFVLLIVLFSFVFMACAGQQKFENKICKEVDGKEKECMSYELTVDSGLL